MHKHPVYGYFGLLYGPFLLLWFRSQFNRAKNGPKSGPKNGPSLLNCHPGQRGAGERQGAQEAEETQPGAREPQGQDRRHIGQRDLLPLQQRSEIIEVT